MAMIFAQQVVDYPCGFSGSQYRQPAVNQVQIGYNGRGGFSSYYPGAVLFALSATQMTGLLDDGPLGGDRYGLHRSPPEEDPPNSGLLVMAVHLAIMVHLVMVVHLEMVSP